MAAPVLDVRASLGLLLVLPAMSFVSDALPVFCRRPLVGFTAVVLSAVLTQMIGFGVWLHHMFTTGCRFSVIPFSPRPRS